MRKSEEGELDQQMARLADGERTAFDPLFRALHPRALRVARAALRDEAAAADVAQSALVNVFARAAEFEAGRAVLPWFYAVVANEIRRAVRARARFVSADGRLDALVADDGAEAELASRELHEALASALDALDAPSAEAIAAVLGKGPLPDVSAPAFRKRISRAYARLRVLLGGSS